MGGYKEIKTSLFLIRYGPGYKDPFNFQARLPNLYRVPVSTPRDQWDQLWRSIPYLAVDIPPQARLDSLNNTKYFRLRQPDDVDKERPETVWTTYHCDRTDGQRLRLLTEPKIYIDDKK